VSSIQLNAQDVRLCVGASHDFGVPPILFSKYYWTVSDTSIATITSADTTEQIVIYLSDIGFFKLMVQEVDANGCIGYDSLLLEVISLPSPNIFALGPAAFCEGEQVLLQVDSIYPAMVWMNNGDTIATINEIMVDTTGTYCISVTDTNGCKATSPSINILQHPKPEVNFLLDGVCENMPAEFIDQSTIYLDAISIRKWYLGDGTVDYGDTVGNIYSQAGSYFIKLIVSSDFGCTDSLSRIITIYKQPTADFSFSPYTISTLEPEVNFINTSSSAMPTLWNFGDGNFSYLDNPYHIYEDPGLYDVMLTVSDINNCIDSISKQITMYYDFVFYMPNSFTPNNDDFNDTLIPVAMRMEKYQSYEFIIYDRWGGIVFQTNDIYESWDGSGVKDGEYGWLILIKDELGKIRRETGSVTLFR
jgi:gliding motility-associated-like protein